MTNPATRGRGHRNTPPPSNIPGEPQALYGAFSGRHHARYHEPAMPYHFVARTFQGSALLTPTPELTLLINGVLARALEVYGSVRLYAWAFLANHFHLMASGDPDELPPFIGYIKREISRRWGPKIRWRDTLWSDGYLSTALPTPEAQERCLGYILAQGTKEGIVERPEQWRGAHFARSLLLDEPAKGHWLDSTAFGKASWKQAQKPEAKRKPLDRREFTREMTVTRTTIPAWADLDDATRAERAQEILGRTIEQGREARGGKPALGFASALRTPRTKRWSLPALPWFEERRRMVFWADRRAEAIKAYCARYWQFQREFRAASDRYLAGELDVEFPAGSFRPVLHNRLGATPGEAGAGSRACSPGRAA